MQIWQKLEKSLIFYLNVDSYCINKLKMLSKFICASIICHKMFYKSKKQKWQRKSYLNFYQFFLFLSKNALRWDLVFFFIFGFHFKNNFITITHEQDIAEKILFCSGKTKMTRKALETDSKYYFFSYCFVQKLVMRHLSFVLSQFITSLSSLTILPSRSFAGQLTLLRAPALWRKTHELISNIVITP